MFQIPNPLLLRLLLCCCGYHPNGNSLPCKFTVPEVPVIDCHMTGYPICDPGGGAGKVPRIDLLYHGSLERFTVPKLMTIDNYYLV